MKRVSIIIPNYNGEKLLKKNLPHVFDAVFYYGEKYGLNVEIIVVDDGSVDNSIEYIKNQKSKIKNTDKKSKISFRLLQNVRNLGFSSTVNKGVQEAIGEIVVLVNSDVCPEKKFLEPLLDHFEDKNVSAVGCMDKSIEGTKTVLRGRGIGFWKKGFLMHERGEVDKTNTLWVAGGSGAFRKNIWEKLGGFDTLYDPFYWEDIDVSYRAQKAGFRLLFESKSVVVHQHETGAIKAKYSQSQIKTIAFRNQFIFVWKNITDSDLLVSHVLWLPYHFLKALLRFDGPFFLGFFLALIKLPVIMRKRTDQEKLFVRKDETILKEFLS